MSGSIALHPELGINPRMFCCSKCHKTLDSEGIVLLGRSNYIEICNRCGMKHIGGATRTSYKFGNPKVCQRCGAEDNFTRKDLDEHECIEAGLCPECEKQTHCYLCLNRKDGTPLKEGERAECCNMEPCDQCKKYMEMGVVLISVKAGSEESPMHTGGFVVIKDEAIKRMGEDKPMVQQLLKKRAGFIEDGMWEQMGLPALPGRPATTEAP